MKSRPKVPHPKRTPQLPPIPTSEKSPQEQFTVEQIVRAIHDAHGIVAGAAILLKCDRKTIYNYRDKYPEAVKAAMVEGREGMIDLTELKLFQAIQSSQPWAICFYLKTQAKHRGYVERREWSGPDGGPIPVKPEVRDVLTDPVVRTYLDNAAACIAQLAGHTQIGRANV